jgi:hypothetical protein
MVRIVDALIPNGAALPVQQRRAHADGAWFALLPARWGSNPTFQLVSLCMWKLMTYKDSSMHSLPFVVRWSGPDANAHLRNTAYDEDRPSYLRLGSAAV